MKIMRENSSFRDPSGYVFYEHGIVLRQINKSYQKCYEKLMESGLYNDLTNKAWLVKHTECPTASQTDEESFLVIRPEPIPYISYPYEWTFPQYREAAILTLNIMLQSLKHGMILKDASCYNIQFTGSQPIFIDSLSFDIYEEGQTWDAYGQFCRHFLAPLALMGKLSSDLGQMMKVYIDGIPLELATKLLPWSCRFNIGLYLHLYLHGTKQQTLSLSETKIKNRQKLPRQSLIAIINNLKKTLCYLKDPSNNTSWGNYYVSMHNYTAGAFSDKKSLVKRYLDVSDSRNICDLGANEGVFSQIASERNNSYVISYDLDHTAVSKHYYTIKEKGITNILPLILDITNPSPAIGWANEERASIEQRSNYDCIMALALIHHLSISNNIPFRKTAEFCSRLATYLIIEFVPKDDSQVVKLLLNRKDIYSKYSQDEFEYAFSIYYSILEKNTLKDSKRVLYLLKIKH